MREDFRDSLKTRMKAFDALSGRTLWTRELESRTHPLSSPAVSGQLIVSELEERFATLDPISGALIADFPVQDDSLSAISNGKLITASEGLLRSYDPSNGVVNWA